MAPENLPAPGARCPCMCHSVRKGIATREAADCHFCDDTGDFSQSSEKTTQQLPKPALHLLAEA